MKKQHLHVSAQSNTSRTFFLTVLVSIKSQIPFFVYFISMLEELRGANFLIFTMYAYVRKTLSIICVSRKIQSQIFLLIETLGFLKKYLANFLSHPNFIVGGSLTSGFTAYCNAIANSGVCGYARGRLGA